MGRSEEEERRRGEEGGGGDEKHCSPVDEEKKSETGTWRDSRFVPTASSKPVSGLAGSPEPAAAHQSPA